MIVPGTTVLYIHRLTKTKSIQASNDSVREQ